MKIADIKDILQNKINRLIENRNFAQQAGELEEYVKLDAELKETEATLAELN